MLSRIVRRNVHIETRVFLRSTVSIENPIKGMATETGTLSFVKNANLPLYHKFDKCKLFSNPIIHGLPSVNFMLNECKYGDKIVMQNEETDRLLEKALVDNKSNCIYVYGHNDSSYYSNYKAAPTNDIHGVPYFASKLSHLLCYEDNPPELNKIPRNNVITIADIGMTLNPLEIMKRVQDAKMKTKLEVIDCIVWRCTEDGFYDIDSYDRCKYCIGKYSIYISIYIIGVQVLNMLSMHYKGKREFIYNDKTYHMDSSIACIQFYGIHFHNIAPYCYHTPPRAV